MKLYMFQTVPLSIIRTLFTVHSAMVYVVQVCRQLSSRTRMESCLQTCMTYTIASVQWINSWWWTDKLSETCRVSWQNKFVKLVHLVGFIILRWVIPVVLSRYKYVKNILFLYSHKTQLNIKLSLLLYYNITTTCFGLNYRPSSGCIWNL